MLEHAHNLAYIVVAQRAARLGSEGKIADAAGLEKQMAAIRELEQARVDIFAKHGVLDVIPSTNESEASEKAYTLDELGKLNSGMLSTISFQRRLHLIRVGSGFTQTSLVQAIKEKGQSLHAATLSRLEKGKMMPSAITIRKIILGLGLEESDLIAQLLLEKVKVIKVP